MIETIDTLIIGGGQGGLSLSYHLKQAGREHIVLEKATRPADAWRNRRWDSFTLVTPNWSFMLPGGEYDGPDPHGFMGRGEIVTRFEQYIDRHHLPIQYGVAVSHVAAREEGKGFTVQANDSTWQARQVVVATGVFQQSKIPSFGSQVSTSVIQLTSDQYRNPQSLPEGAVLVAGGGQSGCQIAEELYQSGRKVYLSIGAAPITPRRYRGRDIADWLSLSGFFDRTVAQLPAPQARFGSNPLVTGKDGGHALDLHRFYREGVILLGHLRGFEHDCLQVAPDLQQSLAKSEQMGKIPLKWIDGFIEKAAIDAPAPEPEVSPKDAYAAPEILSLDLRQTGITSIIWSIGYHFDYSMVKHPILDSFGFPITQGGVTRVPGLYFSGLAWMDSQKTGLLLGVGEMTARLAEKIAAF